MNCKHCGLPLDQAQLKDNYKSCPCCSKSDGNEHIFYLKDIFGWTEKRITSYNPEGIQSWCTPCRGEHQGPHKGAVKCSDLNKR